MLSFWNSASLLSFLVVLPVVSDIRTAMIIKLALILAGVSLQSSQGKHVFSFLDNDATSVAVDLRCVSKNRMSDGVVQIPLEDDFFAFNVSFEEETFIDLPLTAIPSGTGETDSTIVVEYDGAIDLHVYALAYGTQGDSFMVLPEHALGVKYYVMSILRDSGDPVFAITPLEQGTDVSIYFNEDFEYDGVTYNRNRFLQVRLNIRSFHVQTDFDPTGTIITASKPVQVISGNKCAGIISSSKCDHIAESLPPIKTWGRNYALVPFAGRSSGYVVKIMAVEDNTDVTLTLQGEAPEVVSLDDGSVEERLIYLPRILTITASKPILVAQFMHSAYSAASNIGNPSMVILPAVEHAIARTLPFTSLDDSFTNYITLWMSNTDINGLRLDGTVMDSWTVIGVAFDGAVVQTQVVPGTHYLSHTNPSVRLCGIAYGHGSSSSYAHPIYYHPFTAVDEDSPTPVSDDCPSEVIAQCPPDANTAVVTWEPPTVSSSYAMLPDYSNYLSGDAFNIGVTKVTYQLSDVHGSVLECNFDVIVQDVTAPAVYGCPSSYNISTCDSHPLFQWEEPYAEDNSGGIHLFKQVDSDAEMSSTVVTYEFSDDSDNIATCVVKIDNSPVGKCNFGPNRNAVVNAVVFLGLFTYFLIMVVSCLLLSRYLPNFVSTLAPKHDGTAARPNDYRPPTSRPKQDGHSEFNLKPKSK